MGDGPTNVDVIFDTSSLGLAVQGTGCSGDCATTLYATGGGSYTDNGGSWSHTYRTSQQSDYWFAAEGVKAQDKVTIDSEELVTKMYTINSVEIEGDEVPQNTGWLGLTLNAAGGSTEYDFIEQWHSNSLLTNREFGFHLVSEAVSGATNYVDFGAIKSASIKSGSTSVTLKVESSNYNWKTQIKGVDFSDGNKWGFKNTYAEWNTNASCVYAPKDQYDWFSE